MSHSFHPAIEKVLDFPDKWTSILVKDLRTYIKSPTFSILFVALHMLLLMFLLSSYSSSSMIRSGDFFSSTLFLLYSLALLIVQPFRAMNVISDEFEHQTIDLLLLTRLNSWKIITGKWLSIAVPSTLIAVSLLPYLILRYQLGGMNLLGELVIFVSILLTSFLLSALAITLSSSSSKILVQISRVLATLILVPILLTTFISKGFKQILPFFSFEELSYFLSFLGLLFLAVFITFLALDFASSAIAPLAENRATKRRLLGLSLLPSCLIVNTLGSGPSSNAFSFFVFFLIIIPVVLFSLTEGPRLTTSICVPFVKRGKFAMFTGRFLYPGWATGLLLFLLFFVVFWGVIAITGKESFLSEPALHASCISLFAALVFPLALRCLFFKKVLKLFQFYLITYAVMAIIALPLYFLVSQLNFIPKKGLAYALSFVPFMGLHKSIDNGIFVVISYIQLAVYFSIPLLYSLPIWKHISDIEKESKDKLASARIDA